MYVFIYRHPFRKKSIGAVGKIVQKGVAVNLCMYGKPHTTMPLTTPEHHRTHAQLR